jgi:hypothetical protein
MSKTKKCECLKEENEIARCDAVDRLKRGDGVFYCPKSRVQYRVTATCWKVLKEEFTL